MTDDLPREQLPANRTVFNFGEAGDSAFIIEAGCVEVLSGDQPPRRLAVLSDGALFGEVALLDGLPRTASVRTLVPTTLIRIERAQVDELLKHTNPVIRHLLRLLIERFRNCQGGIHGYSPGSSGGTTVRDAALRTLVLTRDLSHAIDNGQLELFYQPIVRASDHGLQGFEALVRWRHPVLGMIMPMEFIGLAEKTGLVHRLGQWVMQRAVSDWSRLRRFCGDGGEVPPFVSINLSAAEFAQPGIVEDIQACLAAHAMSPRELKVELTETVVIEDRDIVARVLDRLSALGIAIALDDFGTGYAGLEYLKTLPISCLKIDKNFVQDMAHSLRSYEIVQSAINLAWSLGIATIAEGIEDAETARRLAELGCELFQGYHFARPMPADQVAAWVAAGHA